ncbi:ribonuclease Y [Haliovirga abyssi]|uniref:Ribonuclease Y n=1 Tax=Haliovirga abyssi TaxID=2996794 RepID=A0AAU9DM00_9FUSO|nr:ribonuclease Y [Haliovirga abyssi]BDU51012.1 ribonuclease Y [Haliovirga abyssi]
MASVLAAGLGGVIGYLLRKKVVDAKLGELEEIEKEINSAKDKAKIIIEDSKKEAGTIKKEAIIKAKDESYKIKEEAEKEIKLANGELQIKERRLIKKEEQLDNKIAKIEEKEENIEKKKLTLIKKEEEIESLKVKEEEELERISGLTKDEAKDILLSELQNELDHESALAIKEYEKKIEFEKEKLSKKILSTAIGKAASDYVVETTVSVVQLPNDEMKGRIIGREGRNIRTIEALTGVDVIIDDTPEAVVLSSFDSVRREIAKIAMEKLVADGRIHPAKIEESIEKAKEEVGLAIIEAGEQAVLELGIHSVHPEVIKVLGRLRYRTSYGQNVLVHSIEVGHLAGTLASEIGADVELAKRAGLLHDIGKALDHDIEGSHALIGKDFLRKFKEKPQILNAVAAHHGEEEFESVEAVLVQAADAVSASRPGARRETLETYLKRLEGLEKIANSFEGVETTFAIQAGREIRIIVKPDEINDDRAIKLSRDVAKKIEENMQYPGQIKVMIVRETRSIEYAK